MASLSSHESEESRSRRRAGFHVIQGGAAAGGINTDAITDLTKLPPGFLEGALGGPGLLVACGTWHGAAASQLARWSAACRCSTPAHARACCHAPAALPQSRLPTSAWSSAWARGRLAR